MVPKRSGTKIRLPSRYRQNIEANIVTDTNEDDPLTYRDAIVDCDKEQCQEAMNQEMESMYFNSVWKLVDPSLDVRPI